MPVGGGSSVNNSFNRWRADNFLILELEKTHEKIADFMTAYLPVYEVTVVETFLRVSTSHRIQSRHCSNGDRTSRFPHSHGRSTY